VQLVLPMAHSLIADPVTNGPKVRAPAAKTLPVTVVPSDLICRP
jgi:hypothetical protein